MPGVCHDSCICVNGHVFGNGICRIHRDPNRDSICILADEPTGNLDSKTGAEIMSMFETLHEQGNTIVLITHDLNVARHAQRSLHIVDGQIQMDERNGGI